MTTGSMTGGAALALLMAAAASTGHAASEARRIAPPVGDEVRIVTPAPSGFGHRARHHRKKADPLAVAASIALFDRVQRRASASSRPDTVRVRIEVVPEPLFIPICSRGLFGRPIEKPCVTRPGDTILSYD